VLSIKSLHACGRIKTPSTLIMACVFPLEVLVVQGLKIKRKEPYS